MKKILIIEDEERTAQQLKKNILSYPQKNTVLAVLGSVKDALAYFDKHPEPDLLFCDIELNDGICFQIFEQHPLKCPIIFTTAYDEYWQEAFQTNSIDYLLKPIAKKNLFNSLDKVHAIQDYYAKDGANLEKLVALYKEKSHFKDRLLIKVGNRFRVVECKEIAYIFSEDKISTILTHKLEKHLTYESLDQLEKILHPKYFFRANRKYLIHISAIASIHNFFKGRLMVYLKPNLEEGVKIIVSQAKAKAFKKWIESIE